MHVVSPGVLCIHVCRARTEAAYAMALDDAANEALQSEEISDGNLEKLLSPGPHDVSAYLVRFDPMRKRAKKTTFASRLLDQVLTRM